MSVHAVMAVLALAAELDLAVVAVAVLALVWVVASDFNCGLLKNDY